MEPSEKSRKGIYVISFGKDMEPRNPLVETNHSAVAIPDELPRIDVQIKGGDKVTAETRNGKVVRVTRNGVKIDKSCIKGKGKEIEEKEKKQEQSR